LAEGIDMQAAFTELEAALPGLHDHNEPDNPGMHTTVTIDFEYVVSGRVVLELDDGASSLRRRLAVRTPPRSRCRTRTASRTPRRRASRP
ncbi:MAG TPA: hypothetical protein VFI47_30820, partial [Acidimicrobiales bacterium]|nr:hypothetical protein [Acidimicrobiales bacterium]